MFLKPFRVKSNSLMKNSERKTFKNKIRSKFSIEESVLDRIISSKDPISTSKIITYSNNVVVVYLYKKKPIIFEFDNELYPTVYFLWDFCDILSYFTTHSSVVPKLSSGADLMLPGVFFPNIEGPRKYGRFEKGALVAVNVSTNKAAVAVGTTAHSSMDMFMAAGRGKCVNILHCINDYLYKMDEQLFPPELGPPEWLIETNSNDEQQNDTIETVNDDNIDKTSANEDTNIESVSDEKKCDNVQNLSETDIMDKLLKYCFLKTLKYSRKKITLPILTSAFYRSYLMEACPKGKTVDIKKSSYKKLNKFLNEMRNEEIIKLHEQVKGVESISSINWEHPWIVEFVRDSDDRPEELINTDSKLPSLNIEENFNVTAAVLPIFADAGLRKGDTLKAADVRRIVTDYVKRKKLNSLENRNIVVPNKEISNIIKKDENVTWEELMQIIFKLMSSSFKISNEGVQVSGKGKIEPIVMTVALRSGNKKVTIVDNLELYGIQITDFSKECQHGVAASTTISKPLGKKYDQLTIQGNQVAFVGNLLMGKYNIPKRLIRGLELAVKNKK